MKIAVGVDIGGTNIKTVVVSGEGKILSSLSHPTPGKEDKVALKDLMVGVLKEIINEDYLNKISSSEAGINDIAGIGFGIAGLIDSKEGVVIESPNIPNINGLNIKKIFEKEFPFPVVVNNDANICAYGEKWGGTGKDFDNFIVLTLGTGLGGGFIYRGELYEGAFEIGHMVIEPNGLFCTCGSSGCLESYASGRAIVERATTAMEKGTESILTKCCDGNFYKITPEDIYKAALDGDNLSRELFRPLGHYLGIGIANLINLLSPEAVIIGGGLVGAWDLFIEELEKEVSKRAFKPLNARVKILKTVLNKECGSVGAAGLAFNAAKLSAK
jgi:glucokinase